jgi:site-specific DNA-methyltransferase (cytosine-N4-specific)
VKGKALELLAMHLCRLLGLRLVAWRHRWRETGGAEVDVIAEGTNLVFVRWEIQCKNTPRVSLEDLAREIGIADFYHANVVMIVTTGKFAKPAIDFAEKKMERSGLNIVLLDGSTLQQIVKSPHSMGDVLGRFAQRAMTLKRLKDLG